MDSNAATLEAMPYRKWAYMMDWCRIHGLPAAHEWAWRKAEEAWIKAQTPAPAGNPPAEAGT